jgi:uncharacterized membrane protein YkvA (DUF1232 family)
MFYISLLAELFALESSKCMERRLTGRFTVRPSSVLFLLFAFFYAVSPVDFIPEAFINSWAAYIDDVIVCAAALCYAIADITSALEGRRMREKPLDATEPLNEETE